MLWNLWPGFSTYFSRASPPVKKGVLAPKWRGDTRFLLCKSTAKWPCAAESGTALKSGRVGRDGPHARKISCASLFPIVVVRCLRMKFYADSPAAWRKSSRLTKPRRALQFSPGWGRPAGRQPLPAGPRGEPEIKTQLRIVHTPRRRLQPQSPTSRGSGQSVIVITSPSPLHFLRRREPPAASRWGTAPPGGSPASPPGPRCEGRRRPSWGTGPAPGT